uniref:FRIGIDA-like protein n=1 Tax=Aegilops tauschii subsp. strangulata TaxID=200361 RepID=A0A453CYT0_AEGTS
DTTAFFRFVAARRKRSTQPAVMCCLDPGKSVMDAIADVFPMDRLELKNLQTLPGAWTCILILEETVQALPGPDPEIRLARPLRRATLTMRGDLSRLPRVTHSPNSTASAPACKGRCSCWPATVRSPTSQGRSFPKQRSHSRLLCAADRTG